MGVEQQKAGEGCEALRRDARVVRRYVTANLAAMLFFTGVLALRGLGGEEFMGGYPEWEQAFTSAFGDFGFVAWLVVHIGATAAAIGGGIFSVLAIIHGTDYRSEVWRPTKPKDLKPARWSVMLTSLTSLTVAAAWAGVWLAGQVGGVASAHLAVIVTVLLVTLLPRPARAHARIVNAGVAWWTSQPGYVPVWDAVAQRTELDNHTPGPTAPHDWGPADDAAVLRARRWIRLHQVLSTVAFCIAGGALVTAAVLTGAGAAAVTAMFAVMLGGFFILAQAAINILCEIDPRDRYESDTPPTERKHRSAAAAIIATPVVLIGVLALVALDQLSRGGQGAVLGLHPQALLGAVVGAVSCSALLAWRAMARIFAALRRWREVVE